MTKYWLGVRNLGRKFGKMKNINWSLKPKNGLPNFFVEAKWIVLNMNIHMPGSKI